MNVKISPHWQPLLKNEFEKPYFKLLAEKIRTEYLTKSVYPAPKNIFRAFDECPPEEVRVVILGQDPYHTPGVADGLSFSSLPGNPIPPSLQNIYKEIESEYGGPCAPTPDLMRWARQGVLLLNASLTVESGLANSHALHGWHTFTDAVIQAISKSKSHVVFLLWGSFAGKKDVLIDTSKHLVLKSPHPSPLSAYRGFLGNGHFRKTNEYLMMHKKSVIEWK